MKKYILSTLSLALFYSCSSTHTTTSGSSIPVTNNYKLEQALLSISETSLSNNLHIIASDDMKGRKTGEEGQKKAAEYIVNFYKNLGLKNPPGTMGYTQKVPSEFMKSGFSPKLNDSDNLWAYIPGTTHPEEVVIISAHYDHIGEQNGEVYNGADDDGSGTVAVMEIAKTFAEAKRNGLMPKRSVLFLNLTGEEFGLWGSKYYNENPVFPSKNSVADINIDMVGRRDTLNTHKTNGKYIYVIGADRLSSELKTIVEEQNSKFSKLELDYKYDDRNDPNRYYYRSDHYSFAKKGIPAVFLFNGTHDDYHGKDDTADKIEYDLLAARTKLAFSIAWELANREKRIVIDRDGK